METFEISIIIHSIGNKGTPGVGKTRICAEIAKLRSMKWQDVSKIAKENGFVEEFDEQLSCPVLDEDKVSAKMQLFSWNNYLNG